MATIAGTDGRHVTICPACGYPSAGLCAACVQTSAVPGDPAMNTNADLSWPDPVWLIQVE
jgi:hypothetical protein